MAWLYFSSQFSLILLILKMWYSNPYHFNYQWFYEHSIEKYISLTPRPRIGHETMLTNILIPDWKISVLGTASGHTITYTQGDNTTHCFIISSLPSWYWIYPNQRINPTGGNCNVQSESRTTPAEGMTNASRDITMTLLHA